MKTDTVIEAMAKVIQARKTQLENLRTSTVPHIAATYKDDDNSLSQEIASMELLISSDFVEYLAGQLGKMENA